MSLLPTLKRFNTLFCVSFVDLEQVYAGWVYTDHQKLISLIIFNERRKNLTFHQILYTKLIWWLTQAWNIKTRSTSFQSNRYKMKKLQPILNPIMNTIHRNTMIMKYFDKLYISDGVKIALATHGLGNI